MLCVQEIKLKGALAGGHKMLHAGGDGKSNGVGIIVPEGISKDVARVGRWQGKIVVAWMMEKRHLVCIIYVNGPQTGRVETEKWASREELERLVLSTTRILRKLL